MSAFHQASRIEARAMADLLPLLRRYAFDGRFVTTEKGTMSDFIFYYFVEEKDLSIVRFEKLRRWAFGSREAQTQGRIYSFPEKPQSKYDQMNDTWGRCVPIGIIEREVGLRRMSLAGVEEECNFTTPAGPAAALVFKDSLFELAAEENAEGQHA